MATSQGIEGRWTLRVCKKCGGHHGRLHDGCETHSHPMYPQATERAGVDEVPVVPCDDAAVERGARQIESQWQGVSPDVARTVAANVLRAAGGQHG